MIELPPVSIVIADTRSIEHPKWVGYAINSANTQYYPEVELIVQDNLAKETIGKAWNKAVKKAEGELILFIGDDDYITQDYVMTLVSYYLEVIKFKKDVVGVTSFLTTFDDNRKEKSQLQLFPTGIYKKEYLLEHPFNEEMRKGVDTEYVKQMELRGDKQVCVKWHYGYYYRQHDGMTSGRSVKYVNKKKESK